MKYLVAIIVSASWLTGCTLPDNDREFYPAVKGTYSCGSAATRRAVPTPELGARQTSFTVIGQFPDPGGKTRVLLAHPLALLGSLDAAGEGDAVVVLGHGARAPRSDRLGAAEQAFLAERDTLFMASVGDNGWPYVQHRGGRLTR